jgi:hypothetical protein
LGRQGKTSLQFQGPHGHGLARLKPHVFLGWLDKNHLYFQDVGRQNQTYFFRGVWMAGLKPLFSPFLPGWQD